MNFLRKMFFSFLLIAVTLLLFSTSQVFANPISEISRSQAEADLKADLLNKYKGSYSTVDTLLTAGMADYDKLASAPNTEVDNEIINKLKSQYYPSFSTIYMLYQADKEAYNKLNQR